MKLIKPTVITDNGGTFARASIGTYFDANGVMQTADIDEPRYDYDPITGAFRGLLLENEATNLFTASDRMFDRSYWTVQEFLANFFTCTESDEVPSPYDGVETVTKFINVSGAAGLFARKTITITAGVYTASIMVFVPAQIGVSSYRISSDVADRYFSTSQSIAVFDRWVRVCVAVTVLDTSGFFDFNIMVNEVNPTSGFFFYTCCANLVAETSPSSHIPTTTSPVTRAADISTSVATTRAADVFTGSLLSTVPENDYPPWSGVTAYAIGTRCLYNHKVYECLVANTNFVPPNYTATVPPKWLDCGYDNRWKMFDAVVGSQTTASESFTVSIRPGVVDSIAFLDVDATLIEIAMTDPVEGLVYQETIDMVDNSIVVDAYTYFFTPVLSSDAAVLLGIPPFGSATITVKVSNPGGTAKVGTMVVGTNRDLGITQYDPSIGVTDYSRKEVDQFGNYTVVQRPYSKRLSCDMVMPSNQVDQLQKLLASYRAIPVVWVGVDEGYSSMIIYGFYKSFQISIPMPNDATCSLEIEGLS